MSTPRDLLNAAKAEIREIDPNDVAARLDHFTLLDVREPDEYEQGAVPGAVHLPRGNLEFSVEGRLPDKNAPIVVYCAGGVRSAFAAKTLQDLGYSDVVSMIGGFNKWKDEGLTWTTPRVLSADQRNRYQRHLLLPEVGEEGQQRLLGLEGAAARRRRTRFAGGALSRRGRRRDDRHHRYGRRRRLEPPAPDPAQRGPHRRAQGRLARRRPSPQ